MRGRYSVPFCSLPILLLSNKTPRDPRCFAYTYFISSSPGDGGREIIKWRKNEIEKGRSRIKEERDGKRRKGEKLGIFRGWTRRRYAKRWSRQLRHCIPNRKKRQSEQNTVGASLRKHSALTNEEWDEGLKLGTKVLTFVPSKVFRIMAIAERKAEGKGGRHRERYLCDLYLTKVSELLNFPGHRKKGGEGNDGYDGEEFLRERACTVIKPFSNEDWSVN